MNIPIQIANSTSQVVVRAEDPYNPLFYATLALAIFTGVLALVVFIGNLQTNRNTRESNERLELELKTRLRPMFEFVEFNHLSEIEQGKKYAAFGAELQNTGTVPVDKLQIYFNFGNQKPSSLREILKERDFWRKRGFVEDFGSLLPNSRIGITTGKFQYDESPTNPLWFVLWFEYTYLENINEQCIYVIRINGHTTFRENVIFYSNYNIGEENNSKKNDVHF